METVKDYLQFTIDKLNEVSDTQSENINEAANYIAQSCINGGRFYVFGSGHSHMIAEEIYIRAGGLALVNAILPEELMLHQMPNKSTYIERIEGYASAMLELYKVDEKDTILVISNSGRNAVPIEMAMYAKEKGLKVIALTSLTPAKAATSRHSSGKKLHEVADVVIDNMSPQGDAAYYVKGLDTPSGPTSDSVGIAIAQAMIVKSLELMVEQGFEPPVFKSSNVDGADEYNNNLFDVHYGYWK